MSKCRLCNVDLTYENWYPSCKKKKDYICKRCAGERSLLWRKANPDKVKEMSKFANTKQHRKHGALPFNENRECSSFLGVHVAERVLRHVFNDVEVMPYGNPGYDIICNRGKLIDSKAACMAMPGRSLGVWNFHIRMNKIADYFVLLAFDNRDDTNPLHCWMIPGDLINHLTSASISVSTIDKWDEYKLDIDRVVVCCDAMRGV